MGLLENAVREIVVEELQKTPTLLNEGRVKALVTEQINAAVSDAVKEQIDTAIEEADVEKLIEEKIGDAAEAAAESAAEEKVSEVDAEKLVTDAAETAVEGLDITQIANDSVDEHIERNIDIDDLMLTAIGEKVEKFVDGDVVERLLTNVLKDQLSDLIHDFFVSDTGNDLLMESLREIFSEAFTHNAAPVVVNPPAVQEVKQTAA